MRLSQVQGPDLYIHSIQEAIHSHPQGRYHHRLHVVLMALRLHNAKEASAIYQEPLRTVQHWMQRFFEKGLGGLQDEMISGRPCRLSEKQKQDLKTDLLRSPRFVGYAQNNWDGKLLSHHIQKTYHISLQVRQCQYLLHSLGFTLQRPRSVPKGDPEKKAEFKKKRISS